MDVCYLINGIEKSPAGIKCRQGWIKETFCGVGLNHHTLQSAVVFLCRRANPPLKNLRKEDESDDARKS
jgi:hypothetical protein